MASSGSRLEEASSWMCWSSWETSAWLPVASGPATPLDVSDEAARAKRGRKDPSSRMIAMQNPELGEIVAPGIAPKVSRTPHEARCL